MKENDLIGWFFLIIGAIVCFYGAYVSKVYLMIIGFLIVISSSYFFKFEKEEKENEKLS